MDTITFKLVEQKDLQMMHDRLKNDHIQWWYDWGDESFEEYSQWMNNRINNPYQFPYIFFIDQVPVWYIQCYDCYGLAGDVYASIVKRGTWWVDMYLWDETYLWKWRWSNVLHQFVWFVKENYSATTVSIDPTPDNIRAIKAYEKAWFERKTKFTIDWNTHLLMIYSTSRYAKKIFSNHRSRLWEAKTIKIIKEFDHWRFVYEITTTQEKKYILKWLPIKKSKELSQTAEVLHYISVHWFARYPNIFLSDDNQIYSTKWKTIYHIMEYIEGNHPIWNVETYALLWKRIAQLHNIPHKWCQHMSVRNLKNERESLLSNAKKYNLWEQYLTIIEKFPDFTTLPRAIIHTDVHVWNTIQKENWELYFIDRDSVAVWTRIFDLWFFISMQFIDLESNFNEKRAKAFFEAYEENVHTSLTQNEKESMIDAWLFYSTVCVQFGDIERNWRRIQWIDKQREMIYNSILS